jgi:hypothetical protein
MFYQLFHLRGETLEELVAISREGTVTLILDEVKFWFSIPSVTHILSEVLLLVHLP